MSTFASRVVAWCSLTALTVGCGSSGAAHDTSTGGSASGGASGGSSGGGSTPTGGQDGLGGGDSDPTGAIACRTDGDGKTTLAFVNRCADPLAYAGSELTGGLLDPGQVVCIDIGSDVEALSAKRYWGWVGEDPGAEHHTLAEFTFNTDFHDFDWYNISHVDAFNLPMQIVPAARADCDTLTCAEDLLTSCPTVGAYEDEAGTITACVSPDRDDPSSPVAMYFERCDDAYAWSGDDQQGDDPSPVKACAGEDWDIVFCPEK